MLQELSSTKFDEGGYEGGYEGGSFGDDGAGA